MTNSEVLIPIPGRLHSVADVKHVAGADEIYDDLLSKSQETLNGEFTEKEDKVTVESASGATLTAVVGKYYTMSNVGTMAITLPTIAAGTITLQMVAFYISAGSSPAVTFSSTHSIYYSDGFEIVANTTYEVNAVYNGIAWVVTSVKIIIPSP